MTYEETLNLINIVEDEIVQIHEWSVNNNNLLKEELDIIAGTLIEIKEKMKETK